MSLGMYTQDEVRDFAEPPRNVTPKVNPFIMPEPEPEPEPEELAQEPAKELETIEAEIVLEKKAPAKKAGFALDEMIKELEKEVTP
jgi:hypothetical protein